MFIGVLQKEATLICGFVYLQELYSRQKKNLQNNLNRKGKKCLGETYSKGHSDFRSIIYPYNHPFPQDEVEVIISKGFMD